MQHLDLRVGHVLDTLAQLKSEGKKVRCVVTSPPYFGLRAYGTKPQIWANGHALCVEHAWMDSSWKNQNASGGGQGKQKTNRGSYVADYKERKIPSDTCAVCGAWRGELGLEPTPELYVAHLVEVFRAVRDVLHDDGTVFLNLGDSYAQERWGRGDAPAPKNTGNKKAISRSRGGDGLKPKDLIGIPWRVAFALQADGWYLRSDIIWAKAISGAIRKGSSMPESVRDRFCKSHEYIFLLSKSPRYYFDLDAVADEIDVSESHEYSGKHENKNLQPVQARKTTGDVQQEQSTVGRLHGEMQGLPFNHSQGMGLQVQPFEQSADDSQALLLFREGTSDKESIPQDLCSDGRTERTVSHRGTPARKNGKIQSPPKALQRKALQRKRKGQGVQGTQGQEILSKSEGQVLEAQDGDQAQVSNQVNRLHTDQNPMGTNQGEVREPLRVLSETDATLGDGSRYPAVEERETHGGEYSTGVSDVQREQGKSSRATRRDVWLVNPKPYRGAHFATYPPALVEPCILAGTSARGQCPKCGKPWERVTEKAERIQAHWEGTKQNHAIAAKGKHGATSVIETGSYQTYKTIGWRATCSCNLDPIPDVVLDIFNGSGTTGEVALRKGRSYIGCELNSDYAALSFERWRKAGVLDADGRVMPSQAPARADAMLPGFEVAGV